MQNAKIEASLKKLFAKHDVIFWNDPDGTTIEEFSGISIPGVVKLILGSNLFAVKVAIMRELKYPGFELLKDLTFPFQDEINAARAAAADRIEEPQIFSGYHTSSYPGSRLKFLLYRGGPAPEDHDNWLLDIELSSGAFSADRDSLLCDELGLDPATFRELTGSCPAFFGTPAFRKRLKALLNPTPGKGALGSSTGGDASASGSQYPSSSYPSPSASLFSSQNSPGDEPAPAPAPAVSRETRESLLLKMLCIASSLEGTESTDELLMTLLHREFLRLNPGADLESPDGNSRDDQSEDPVLTYHAGDLTGSGTGGRRQSRKGAGNKKLSTAETNHEIDFGSKIYYSAPDASAGEDLGTMSSAPGGKESGDLSSPESLDTCTILFRDPLLKSALADILNREFGCGSQRGDSGQFSSGRGWEARGSADLSGSTDSTGRNLIYDLAMQLFRQSLSSQIAEVSGSGRLGYSLQTGEQQKTDSALRLLRRWNDSNKYRLSYQYWSECAAGDLQADNKLAELDSSALCEIRHFAAADRIMLSRIIPQIAAGKITEQQIREYAAHRQERSLFRGDPRDMFLQTWNTAILAGALLEKIRKTELSMGSIEEAVTKYASSWHEVDQLQRNFNSSLQELRSGEGSELTSQARKFCEDLFLLPVQGGRSTCPSGDLPPRGNASFRESAPAGSPDSGGIAGVSLKELTDNIYLNSYLRPLSQKFSSALEREHRWNRHGRIPLQQDFFINRIRPYTQNRNKLAVIISDGFRYEMGVQLTGEINRENRFSAEIEPMLSMLPSYTQLGMAALLPHTTLEIMDDLSVLADGQRTAGIEDRKKVLQNAGVNICCLQASEVLSKGSPLIRELMPRHDIFYIYHDLMDNTGEHDEDHLFLKSGECVQELKKIIKTLTSGNFNNILVTADHGFCFSESGSDDTRSRDMIDSPIPQGENSVIKRRFALLGKNRSASAASDCVTMTAEDLGLAGNMSVLFPKALQRIRIQGERGRYFHGGATLQETVIPLIRIRKQRSDNVTLVGYRMISSTRSITTNQITLRFSQTEPVQEKVQEIRLRAYFCTPDNQIVSDVPEFTLDSRSEDPREWEKQIRFIFNATSPVMILKIEKYDSRKKAFVPDQKIEGFTKAKSIIERDFF